MSETKLKLGDLFILSLFFKDVVSATSPFHSAHFRVAIRADSDCGVQVTVTDNLYGVSGNNRCGDHFAPASSWSLVSFALTIWQEAQKTYGQAVTISSPLLSAPPPWG